MHAPGRTKRQCDPRVKVTGLVQKLAQLEAVNSDLQSKYWANLRLMGQPCNFYAREPYRRGADGGPVGGLGRAGGGGRAEQQAVGGEPHRAVAQIA